MSRDFFSNQSVKAVGLAFVMTLSLCRCNAAVEEAVAEAVEDTAQQAEMAMLLQSSVTTTAAAVDAIAEGSSEDGETAQLQLSGDTRDCPTSGAVTTNPETGLISFDECVASAASYTLTADGFVGVTFGENLSATIVSDITVGFVTAEDHEYEYTQGGTVEVTLTETDAAVSFTDFDGTIYSDDVEYVYAVDGDLAYGFESRTVTGEVTVSNGDVTLTCEFEDFNVETAGSDEWIEACLF